MLSSVPVDVPESRSAQPSGTRRILNLKQAAEYLGISRSHLLNIMNGKVKGVPRLQPIRAGRRLLFLRESLDQWLREAESRAAGADSQDVLARQVKRDVNMPSEHQETTP